MKCNVGGADRMIRILAGLAILGVGGVTQSPWCLFGFVPLLTGVFRFCPAYTLLKLDTSSGKSCCAGKSECATKKA